MQKILSILGLVFLGAVSAWDNNPPISSRYPGYQIGNGKSGIEIELFIDLMCSDCAA
jgi:hypothetical protein